MRLEYNRQELLFRKLVDQEIPDALKEWSNQKYLGYTIDFKELPICMADAVEESGTQYIMSRAICTITNDTTNEIQDLLIFLRSLLLQTLVSRLITVTCRSLTCTLGPLDGV